MKFWNLNNLTKWRLILILIQKKDAVNRFENSVCGKTVENLRKRINVRLVNNARYYKKYVSKPSFVLQNIFSKDLVAIHEIKPVLTFAKPIDVEHR